MLEEKIGQMTHTISATLRDTSKYEQMYEQEWDWKNLTMINIIFLASMIHISECNSYMHNFRLAEVYPMSVSPRSKFTLEEYIQAHKIQKKLEYRSRSRSRGKKRDFSTEQKEQMENMYVQMDKWST